MAFSDAEIQEIKARLGYTAMKITARPYLDVVAAFEAVVQSNVNEYGEGYIRNTLLPRLRQLRTDLYNSRSRAKVKELVGEIVFDTDEVRRLKALERDTLNELSSYVGIPIAPVPEFQGQAGGYHVLVS